MHHRLSRVRESPKGAAKSAFLISTPTNIFYLSGFLPLTSSDREAFLLVTPKNAILFHSPLAQPKALPSITPLPFARPFTTQLKRVLQAQKLEELLFESQNFTVAEYTSLKQAIKLVPQTASVATLRQEKDQREIVLITRACELATQTITFLKPYLQPGKTEKELAWLAEKYLREEGADSLAFPIIIASGPHSAIPHHTVSPRQLQSGDTVLVDLGCKIAGYCSDITRTFFVGSPTSEQKRVESVIKQAHQAALNQIKKTRPPYKDGSCKAIAVDSAARKIINRAGFKQYFTHGTGHSLGLDIHEAPSISPHSQSILKPNMVITIEPGVYLPGKFGYRHEDTILITKSGYKSLTSKSLPRSEALRG